MSICVCVAVCVSAPMEGTMWTKASDFPSPTRYLLILFKKWLYGTACRFLFHMVSDKFLKNAYQCLSMRTHVPRMDAVWQRVDIFLHLPQYKLSSPISQLWHM